MTLILAVNSGDAVIVAADRRLSIDGQVIEEESTKLTVLVTPDARMVVAYTGIARFGSFETETWLVENLHNPDATVFQLLEVLRTRLPDALAQAGVLNQALTVLLAGYVYDDAADAAPVPRAWRVTNWEHTLPDVVGREFVEIAEDFANNPVIVAGAAGAVNAKSLEQLHGLVALHAPGDGIRNKLRSMIRDASARKRAGDTIGAQCNVCVVRPGPEHDIRATYYSASPTRRMYGVNTVFTAGGGMMTRGGVLEVGEGLPSAGLPEVGRNEPCPCGSGQKSKRCHRRLGYTYLPLTAEMKFKEPPFPSSGRRITVRSYGDVG